jgi:glycosyltransferase involved in cell wall biosynthesis
MLGANHTIFEHQYFSLSPWNQFCGFRLLAKSDLLYLWFASIRSIPLVLVARVLGKPVVTVVGGYEAANCPEISYGSARSGWQRALTNLILGRSAAIVAVSRSSEREIANNLGVAASRVTMIHHGFEDIAGTEQRKMRESVLTVGLVSDVTWLRKGVADFVRCAEQMPTTQFVHVGRVTTDVGAKWGRALPANLSFRGEVSGEQLVQELSSAKVYLQLSRHEAFGCSVAEAMLHRCVPVVSNRYALPEVVGDAGIVVDPDNERAVIEALREALAAREASAQAARERVLGQFSYAKRQECLLQLVERAAK